MSAYNVHRCSVTINIRSTTIELESTILGCLLGTLDFGLKFNLPQTIQALLKLRIVKKEKIFSLKTVENFNLVFSNMQYVHQVIQDFFQTSRYQGIVKATVSGVFVGCLSLAETANGADSGQLQFQSEPSEILNLRSPNTQKPIAFNIP